MHAAEFLGFELDGVLKQTNQKDIGIRDCAAAKDTGPVHKSFLFLFFKKEALA
jgi:hypothetical protein